MKNNWRILGETILINIGLIILSVITIQVTNSYFKYMSWYSDITLGLIIYTILGTIHNIVYIRKQSKNNFQFNKAAMIPAFLMSTSMIIMYIFIIIGSTLN